MKKAICTLILASALLSCAGSARPWRPLYFESQMEEPGDKSDTSNFIHISTKSGPLSLELLGRSDTLLENSYRLFIQIGIYGNPGFDSLRLILKPQKVRVSANGLDCMGATVAVQRNMRPWDANSLHFFFIDKDTLLAASAESSMVYLQINLDGYAVYDGRPIVIPPIVAFDPWFRRWVHSDSLN